MAIDLSVECHLFNGRAIKHANLRGRCLVQSEEAIGCFDYLYLYLSYLNYVSLKCVTYFIFLLHFQHKKDRKHIVRVCNLLTVAIYHIVI